MAIQALKGSGRQLPASRFLVPGLGLVISLVAAWLAVQGVDLATVGELLGRVDPGILVLAICFVGFELWVRALRWSLLLPPGPSGRPSTGRLVPVALVGYLGNTVLPARIGDVLMAVLASRRESVPVAGALGSVVLMRVFDTLALALLVFPAAIIAGAPEGLIRAAGVAAVLAAAVLLFAQTSIPASIIGFARRRIRWAPATALLDHGVRFLEAMSGKGRVPVFAAAMTLTLGIWILEATVYWLTALSLNVGLTPAAALLVAAVAVLGTAVPSAPGYVGTFELAASTLARALGVEPSAALAYAILVHAVTALPLAIGGVVAMAWLGIGPGALRRSTSVSADPHPAAAEEPR
jgi:uncharacterized protein (TIRG00374 family)